MSKKTIGLVVLIIGVVLALISLIADLIGIGTYPGINYAQIIGIGIGVILIIIGGWLMLIKPKKKS